MAVGMDKLDTATEFKPDDYELGCQREYLRQWNE